MALRLDDAMLRGDGKAVCGPGQIKAQLSGCIVPDLNLTSCGCTIDRGSCEDELFWMDGPRLGLPG